MASPDDDDSTPDAGDTSGPDSGTSQGDPSPNSDPGSEPIQLAQGPAGPDSGSDVGSDASPPQVITQRFPDGRTIVVHVEGEGSPNSAPTPSPDPSPSPSPKPSESDDSGKIKALMVQDGVLTAAGAGSLAYATSAAGGPAAVAEAEVGMLPALVEAAPIATALGVIGVVFGVGFGLAALYRWRNRPKEVQEPK